MHVLQQCDVLVNTLPSTPHTTHMLTLPLLREAAASRRRPPPLPPHPFCSLDEQTQRQEREREGDEGQAVSLPLLINVGRGDIITTADLLVALGSGEEEGMAEGVERGNTQACLSYAVLDVVEEEPLPPSSPLWTHPRVSLTPHISAISTPELVMDVFLDNLERFLQYHDDNEEREEGEEEEEEGQSPLTARLKYVVDRTKGY